MTRFDSRLARLEAASRPHDDPAERMREQRLIDELGDIAGADEPLEVPPPAQFDDFTGWMNAVNEAALQHETPNTKEAKHDDTTK